MKKNALIKFLTVAVLVFFMNASMLSATGKSNSLQVNVLPIHFTFNGTELAPPKDQESFMFNNTVYVPLRFIGYSLNKSVLWDAATKTVHIAEPSETEKVQIHTYQQNAAVTGDQGSKANLKVTSKKLNASNADITYVIQGKKLDPKSSKSGFIINNALYVPLRFFSESVGQQVNWDAKTFTVSSNTSDAKPNTGGNTTDPSTTVPSENGKGEGTTNPANPGGVAGGSGGAVSPGTSGKSYDSITNATQSKLEALQQSTKDQFYDLARQYLKTDDAAEKQRIKAQADKVFESTSNQFNSIVSSAKDQLQSNGYSTDVTKEYQAEFDKQVNLGKEIVEGMKD
ncbi:hypothetical protein BVG16_07065 [Paenibacillus selenitireducens]|uniref:Copper amine oxidase-like N-terminal domain-containing protein n=1 Tax=Paenibacillus selenitireducens TaxID=1324314 RepID=A0A1T2XKT2_9BACL|nr:stalk domain-containing protein [Paenibacillus selenitireducens]OPA80481.1 hypothetical protein BVG16_07065 [Paenibacillus selenitireducens]